jgi:2-oxo-4-hydroxy-4-carboxy-5-ureidoimidazoline decarboxylase
MQGAAAMPDQSGKGPVSGARPLTDAVGEPTADGPGPAALPIADAAREPAGQALDRQAPTEQTLGGLDWLNGLPRDEAVEVLLGCCAAPGWARRVAEGRPHRTTAGLLAAADAAWADRGPGELDAAMAGHPRIGDRGARVPAWSRQEQSGVGSDPGALEALHDANVAYERQFGHVFLICATGRGPDEILAELRRRMANDRSTEREVAAAEIGKINAIRLRKLVAASELEGRGAAWTEERGTSDEGRRRPKAPRKRAGDTA